MTDLMSSVGNGVGASWESSPKLRQKPESASLPRKHPSVWHRVCPLVMFGLFSVCPFLTTSLFKYVTFFLLRFASPAHAMPNS
jgi:hypothetical protein